MALAAYTSIGESFYWETEIKRSRFIAAVSGITSAEEGEAFLEACRKTYRDATHYCYAYRIGREPVREKSSDDGEPAGTAGHPMLFVLQREALTDVIAVVIRYFAGIKLGAGGLARAYGGTLAEALKAAPLLHYVPYIRLRIRMAYDSLGGFENFIRDRDIHIERRIFDEAVTLEVLVLPSEKESLLRAVADMTGGRAEAEDMGEEYVARPLTRDIL